MIKQSVIKGAIYLHMYLSVYVCRNALAHLCLSVETIVASSSTAVLLNG